MIAKQALVSLTVVVMFHLLLASGSLEQISAIVADKYQSLLKTLVIARFLPDSILSIGVIFFAKDRIIQVTKSLVSHVKSYGICPSG